jgi:alpha-glucosidase
MRQPWDAHDLREVIDEALGLASESGGSLPWVLGNHDITRVASRLGVDQNLIRDPTDELRRGIAPVNLTLGTRRARAAALLQLALPGSAYLYQGEELGLPEHFTIPAAHRHDPTFHRTKGAAVGRDGCRVPIPWSGQRPPYGFSAGHARTWLPQPDDWAALTVEAQQNTPDSTLSLYKKALRLRRSLPALGDGTLTWREMAPNTLTFDRAPDFTCMVNLGNEPVPLPARHRILLSSGPCDGRSLPPDTAAWLQG